jgi:hypothetical protein
VSFRRRRFADAVDRQLDLFEHENADLLARIAAARDAYSGAAEDPEERYSELLDLVEIATDELEEMRDAFAATLDDEAAKDYEQAYDRAWRKRFPILRAAG